MRDEKWAELQELIRRRGLLPAGIAEKVREVVRDAVLEALEAADQELLVSNEGTPYAAPAGPDGGRSENDRMVEAAAFEAAGAVAKALRRWL